MAVEKRSAKEEKEQSTEKTAGTLGSVDTGDTARKLGRVEGCAYERQEESVGEATRRQ